MHAENLTHQVQGQFADAAALAGFPNNTKLSGYEIHMGESVLGPLAAPLVQLTRRSNHTVTLNDGAVAPDGRIWGSYIHGLFDTDEVRHALLAKLAENKGVVLPEDDGHDLNAELDRWANHLADHLDLKRINALLGLTSDEAAG